MDRARPARRRRSDLAAPKRSPAMKTAFGVAALAVLLVAPGPCFALWSIAPVSKERAKEMGMEVRSERAGPNHVRVELEFKAEGLLKNYSRVDLRFGTGNNPP